MGNTSSSDRLRVMRECAQLPPSDQERLASHLIDGVVSLSLSTLDEFLRRKANPAPVERNPNKQLFHRICLAVHPDKNQGGEDTAKELFQIVQRVYARKSSTRRNLNYRERDPFRDIWQQLSHMTSEEKARGIFSRILGLSPHSTALEIEAAFRRRNSRDQMVAWAKARSAVESLKQCHRDIDREINVQDASRTFGKKPHASMNADIRTFFRPAC
eukprot:jgi/Mesvir1/5627/Mv15645-RA.1